MVTCPMCKGEGGERDPVLYNGIGGGPWYECEFCDGEGRIAWWGMMVWWAGGLNDWLCRRWYRKLSKAAIIEVGVAALEEGLDAQTELMQGKDE